MKGASERTEVIHDKKRVLRSVVAFFSRAPTRLDLIISSLGPRTAEEFVGAIREARKRGV